MPRVTDQADPNRCQCVRGEGQCPNIAVEGTKYCEDHLGVGHRSVRKHKWRNYILGNPDLQSRYDRFSAVEEMRSLRDEIALARAVIEKRLGEIHTESDFLAACGTVNSYLQTIEKLVSSCHRMEVSLGNLLNKASIFALGKELVEILIEELEGVPGYEEIVDRISAKIASAIAEQENE